jgi:NAD(P)-dependent dehydrogenase (short-subunit alcohol dehydrogenase family)
MKIYGTNLFYNRNDEKAETSVMKQSPTVLITGSAARLGREIALSMARDGWNIALHYNRSFKEARELVTMLEGLGRKTFLIKADLNAPRAVAGIVSSLAEKGIKLDCLINNAAMFEKDSLKTLTQESFHSHIDANLFAPLMLMRDFAAQYEGASGNIINITDGMKGWSMSGAFLSYALSKQALVHATRMLALELAPRIRVNAIAPGATLPGKQDKKDTFAKLKKIIPLGRVSSPLEVCHAIGYILSSPSLTGQILSLGGGMDLL